MRIHGRLHLAAPLLALAACASQTSSGPVAGGELTIVDADPAIRAPFMEALTALEGRWTSVTPYGESEHVFHVSSMGSAVREIMSPGMEHEMTNMYTLDGNGVTMTHYCGAGNQPHMRATAFDGRRLEFRTTGVSDLKDPGEHYMGEMTLVFVDDDHVEQHWTSIENGEKSEIGVFALTRVKP